MNGFLYFRTKTQQFWLAALLILQGLLILQAEVQAYESVEQELRLVWGGAEPRVYQGTISITSGTLEIQRNLNVQPSAAGTQHAINGQTIAIAPHQQSTFGGMDLFVRGNLASQIKIQFQDPTTDRPTEYEVELKQLQEGVWVQPLDSKGNRIAIQRQVYDRLRVHETTVPPLLDANAMWQFSVSGYRTGLAAGQYQLVAQWSGRRSVTPLFSKTVEVDATGSFQPVQLELKAPAKEGGHRLEFQIHRGGLLTNLTGAKPMLVRSIDVGVMDASADTKAIRGWKPLLSVDTVAAIKPGNLAWLTTYTQNALAASSAEVKDLTGLGELKLPEQWSRLVPFSRAMTGVGSVTQVGQISTRTFLSGADSRKGSEQTCVTLAPSSWMALPLTGLQPGQPHRLRIEIPVDEGGNLSVAIKGAGHNDQSLEPQTSVVVNQSDSTQAEGSLTHDFVFWPSREQVSILLANNSRMKPASVGKVLLETAQMETVPAMAADTTISSDSIQSRHTSIYLDQPFLVDCMAAPRVPDTQSGQLLENWDTWQTVAERIVQQMRQAQVDTLHLTAATSSGSLMPLQSLRSLPSLDKSTFFSDGRAPESHDFVELLLRHLDRSKLRLIIEVELPQSLLAAQLNSAGEDDLYQTDVLGQPYRHPQDSPGRPLPCNPLDPKVQSELSRSLREIVQRYATHPSFAGVAVRLNRDSQFLFAGEKWGYNRQLLQEFAATSAVSLPGQSQELQQLFTGPVRLSFLNWRAGRITQWIGQLANEIRRDDPDAQLYLNTIRLWDSEPGSHDFYDLESLHRNPRQFMLCLGLDLQALSEIDGLVVTQGSVRNAWRSLTSKDWQRSAMADQGVSIDPHRMQAALVTHQPKVLSLAKSAASSAEQSSLVRPTVYPDIARHGQFARQALIEQLFRSDVQELGFGGWQPIWTQETELMALLSTFRALPSLPLEDRQLLGSDAPVRIRTGRTDQGSYLAVVNASPQAVQVKLQYNSTVADELELLGQRLDVATEQGPDGMTVLVPPFDMLAWSCSDPDWQVVAAEQSFTEEAVQASIAQIERLEKLMIAATDPTQQRMLFNVGGTFEQWMSPDKPMGWNVSALPQTRIARATELPHSGSHSILIENQNTGQVAAWIQSTPIELPKTGRLTVRAWLRSSAAETQPPVVRLGVIGRRRDGQRYQQQVFYGGVDTDQRTLANDWGRRPAELHIADVPIDDLVDLQVAIDLIGPGKIWVDDVEVVENWLHPDERNYLRGQVLVAKQKLAENNPWPADKLIHGPWNHYLLDLQANLPTTVKSASHPSRQSDSSTPWAGSKSTIQQWRESLLERWRR